VKAPKLDFDGVAMLRALLAAGMRSFCISVHGLTTPADNA
jgi:hypothetical protein